MKKPHRSSVATLALFVAVVGCGSGNDPSSTPTVATPPTPQPTPSKPAVDERPVPATTSGKIRISKETTFFTEPLRSDGRVDYIEALNQRAKQGITPENNVLVPLVKVFGPDFYKNPRRSEFFIRLGVPVPPKRGLYFVDESKLAGKQPGVARFTFLGELKIEIRTGTAAPWSREDLPKLAAWLDANRIPLSRIRTAAEKTHFYSPILLPASEGVDSVLTSVLLSSMATPVRSVCLALTARAMLAAEEFRVEDAIADLIAAHRLARLVMSGQCLIDTLVGVNLEETICKAGTQLLQKATLSDEQLASYDRMLDSLPSWTPAAESINLFERCLALDVISFIARGEEESLQSLVDLLGSEIVPDKAKFAKVVETVDWNIALETTNHEIDRLYAAAIESHYEQRSAALDEFDRQSQQAGGIAKERLKQLASNESIDSRATSQSIANVLISLLASAYTSAVDAQDRSATQLRLLRVTIQLARFRSANGRFPETLKRLLSGGGAKLPIDLYTEKPFVYHLGESGYLLYSVGPNQQDEGGKSRESIPRGDDIVVRMNLAS